LYEHAIQIVIMRSRTSNSFLNHFLEKTLGVIDVTVLNSGFIVRTLAVKGC